MSICNHEPRKQYGDSADTNAPLTPSGTRVTALEPDTTYEQNKSAQFLHVCMEIVNSETVNYFIIKKIGFQNLKRKLFI